VGQDKGVVKMFLAPLASAVELLDTPRYVAACCANM
jgi:hypothetical protein